MWNDDTDIKKRKPPSDKNSDNDKCDEPKKKPNLTNKGDKPVDIGDEITIVEIPKGYVICIVSVICFCYNCIILS